MWETLQIEEVGRFQEPLMVALNSQEILIIGDDEFFDAFDTTMVIIPEENKKEELRNEVNMSGLGLNVFS